jgi:cysteine desulfurase
MTPVYLDCNATTPVEPEVAEAMNNWLVAEYGNASSRTHEFGLNAKRAVGLARKSVAGTLFVEAEEVFFTSGATESNNLAILGLAPWCEQVGKKHLIISAIEHSAVLEPVAWLREHAGFEVTVLPVAGDGVVCPDDLRRSLRSDTALVSIMHVNNETGVIQPLRELASVLDDHPAYLHVDAAQGFGKEFTEIKARRIDMISCTAHKIYGPKGVGALVTKRASSGPIQLRPLMFGGGQEKGLRPGTLPVHLIVGFGIAADLAISRHVERAQINRSFRQRLFEGLSELPLKVHGAERIVLPHVANLGIDGISSEAAMVALREYIAISNGSACTSAKYEPSHVLRAMGLGLDELDAAMRFSWCHLTPTVDWEQICFILKRFI